jgi:hypothetical protein
MPEYRATLGQLDGRNIIFELRAEEKAAGPTFAGVIGESGRDGRWGQDHELLADLINKGQYIDPWTRDKLEQLARLWQRWHLNDLKAGCEHQRAALWEERPIDSSRPLGDYGSFVPDHPKTQTYNMLTWVRPEEHPGGLLTAPCEVCGYRYGSAWLYEPLPVEVTEFVTWFAGIAKEI